jgi:uncharacterized protein (TIGR02996 family)
VGATLADELGTYLVDISRVAYVTTDVLAKLGVLHAAGRTHPALTPANIAITGDAPRLVNIDAPVARIAPYAAPETIRDGTLTIASNLYSVAAITKALLGGRQQRFPEGWLDPDPTRRPATAEEMSQQLADSRWDARTGGRLAPRRCAYVATEPTERDLLATLRANSRDDATREVYADWLEARGDLDRAGWLRGRANAAGDTAWRMILARSAITHCARTDCPRTWDAFAPTAFDNLRTCAACDHSVGYCASELEAELLGAREHFRFAVDDALDAASVLAAFRGAQIPLTTWNPPAPRPLPPPPNPPRPDVRPGDDTTVLGRFLGWFRKQR